MSADVAYAVTRRRGEAGSITRRTGEASVDPETGDVAGVTSTTTVRWLVKEPTKYSRIVRAQAAQQDIGQTTFILWSKDVTFAKVDNEDFVTFGGINYHVKSSTIENGTAFIITADEVV